MFKRMACTIIYPLLVNKYHSIPENGSEKARERKRKGKKTGCCGGSGNWWSWQEIKSIITTVTFSMAFLKATCVKKKFNNDACIYKCRYIYRSIKIIPFVISRLF